jgi:hypothetical protein
MTSSLDDAFDFLKDAVDRYGQAVTRIEHESVSADQILEVLIARELVNTTLKDYENLQRSPFQRLRALLSGKPLYSKRNLLDQVKQLDGRLKNQSSVIQQVIKLSDWQGVLPIFNEPLPWYDRYDWIWRGISLVCFGISLAFLLDIFNRFSTGGLDFLNTLLILISGGITFLSGGASLTNTGQESSERVFNSFGIEQRWWDEIRCLIAVAALSLLILFWHYGLPWFSERYTAQDNLSQANASIAVQESNYQRAIALDPDNYLAHFKLAQLYEEDFAYDSALRKYQDAKRIAKENTDESSQAELGVIRILLKDQKLEQADQRLRGKLENADELSKQAGKLLHQLTPDEYETLKRLGLAYLKADNSTLTEQLQQFLAGSGEAAPALFEVSEAEAAASAGYWFNEGLNRTNENLQNQYEMRSYLGWLYLKQADLPRASATLKDAIAINDIAKAKDYSKEAFAQCLLAQVLYESTKHGSNQPKGTSVSRQTSDFEQAADACTQAASEIEPLAVKDLKETLRRIRIEQVKQ